MINIDFDEVYYSKALPVTKNFELKISKGEIVTLVGASGCGKSTILKIIAGLHQGYSGKLEMQANMRIALVPQNFGVLPWKTVYENVVLLKSLEQKKVDTEKAMELINKLGLSGFEQQYPLRLSGGQYQRVSLGQAFFYEPDILLMDEPFSALDLETKKEACDIFIKMQAEKNITTLFVTHNFEEAKYLNSRIVNINKVRA